MLLEVNKNVLNDFPIPDNYDYLEKYKSFILDCLGKRENKYFKFSECHHILPTCMGGFDEFNRIYLTYKEHYLAHFYLAKAYCEDYKLTFTINMMSSSGKYDTPEKYDEAKRLFLRTISKRMSGPDNPMKNLEISSRFKGGNNNSNKPGIARKIQKIHQENSDYFAEVSRVAKEGRFWVNNGNEMKQIWPNELEHFLSVGYVRGMLKRNTPPKDYDCICKYCGSKYKGGQYSRCCKECNSKIRL